MATDNLLLASLPAAARDRLHARLESVALRTGEILHAPGDEIRHAFFLTGGLVSLEYAGADGDTVELAIVGRDGMVGIPLVLHDLAVPYRAVVRARSTAFRVRASLLQGEWRASQEVHDALLAYAGRVLNQVSQAALCRQGHTALQRLCRWLLTAQDHLGAQPIEMTQETLARALGIARPVAAKALLELQGADAIWCRYGNRTRDGRAHRLGRRFAAAWVWTHHPWKGSAGNPSMLVSNPCPVSGLPSSGFSEVTKDSLA